MTRSPALVTTVTALAGTALCLGWVLLGHPPSSWPAATARLLLVALGVLTVGVVAGSAPQVRELARQVSTARRGDETTARR